MKLNRKWLLAIALVLSLTMAISGTLAYLTDRDTVENTFTMGNVDIEVEENFDQNSPLNPGVSVTKEAGIKNTHATEPAYVWMVVSVTNALANYIELDWAGSYEDTTVTSPHDGYTGYLVKYPSELAAGSSTGNILESVKLAANVDYQNGQYVAVSGGQTTPIGDLSNVSIMVDGFAIQTEGFDGVDAAYTAYTTQWGGLTGGESGTGSGDDEDEPSSTVVGTVAELKDALSAGGNITLSADIDLSNETGTLQVSQSAAIDLNNKRLTVGNNGMQVQDSKKVTLSNGDVTAGVSGEPSILVVDGAEVEFNNVNITTSKSGDSEYNVAEYMPLFVNGGSVVMNGGSLVNEVQNSNGWNYGVIVANGSFTMNSGTITVKNGKTITTDRTASIAFTTSGNATINFNGGTLDASRWIYATENSTTTVNSYDTAFDSSKCWTTNKAVIPTFNYTNTSN